MSIWNDLKDVAKVDVVLNVQSPQKVIVIDDHDVPGDISQRGGLSGIISHSSQKTDHVNYSYEDPDSFKDFKPISFKYKSERPEILAETPTEITPLLGSIDNEDTNNDYSKRFTDPSSIDSGPFCMQETTSKEIAKDNHCSDSSSGPSNPKKRKKLNSCSYPLEPYFGFTDMFNPLTRQYNGCPNFTRQWHWTSFGREYERKPKQKRGLEFRILSYNILSQDLLEEHNYLYNWTKSLNLLSWDYRKWCLLKEIDMLNPDIMCLQEVEQNRYEDFFEPLFEKRGFHGVFCRKSNHQTDGCAIFYRQEYFYLITNFDVDYRRGGVLDRGNVGQIVGLKIRRPISKGCTSNCLFVANTHLVFSPKRGDVKLAQLILLLTELESATYKGKICSDRNLYHPFILCGDFNAEPFSQIYNFVTSGHLLYENLLIREISGQKDENFGPDVYLQRDFFPCHLNINNRCQYNHVFQMRNRQSLLRGQHLTMPPPSPTTGTTRDNKSTVEPSVSTKANESEVTEKRDDNDHRSSWSKFHDGTIQHCFNLCSVYNHMDQIRDPCHTLVSSYHERCCSTVDYIFYQVEGKEAEGQLKLISYYQLPTKTTVRDIEKLPNKHFGSDHFSLMASFLFV